MMPKLDGYQTINAIRNSQKKDAHTISIVAISAKTFDEDIRLSKLAGMNDHLSKPIDGKKLIKTIDYYCGLDSENRDYL